MWTRDNNESGGVRTHRLEGAGISVKQYKSGHCYVYSAKGSFLAGTDLQDAKRQAEAVDAELRAEGR